MLNQRVGIRSPEVLPPAATTSVSRIIKRIKKPSFVDKIYEVSLGFEGLKRLETQNAILYAFWTLLKLESEPRHSNDASFWSDLALIQIKHTKKRQVFSGSEQGPDHYSSFFNYGSIWGLGWIWVLKDAQSKEIHWEYRVTCRCRHDSTVFVWYKTLIIFQVVFSATRWLNLL